MPTINKPKKNYNPQQDKDVLRKQRMKVYNSAKWKNLRTARQMQQPLCEICALSGKVVLSSDIHHWESFTKYTGNEREAVAFDAGNLVSVCKECHYQLHHGFLKGCGSLAEAAERIRLQAATE